MKREICVMDNVDLPIQRLDLATYTDAV